MRYTSVGGGWGPVALAVFKPVWRAAWQGAVGSTPIHPRLENDERSVTNLKAED